MNTLVEDKHSPFRWKTLRPLLRELKPYRREFVLGAFLIGVSSILEVFIPLLMGKAVDVVISPERSSQALYKVCVWFLVVAVAKSVFDGIQSYLIQYTGQSITHRLRSAVFLRLQSLSVTFFDLNPSGRLLTRVINDVKSLGELFSASFSVLALDATVIVVTAVTMCWINLELALWVLCTFPLVIWSVHYFGQRLAKAYRKVRARLSELNGFLGETLPSIPVIQRLVAEAEKKDEFTELSNAHRQAQLETTKVFALVQPSTNVFHGLAVACLLIIGGKSVVRGDLTLGVLVAFLGYIRNLYQPIRDLIEKYNTFLSAAVSAERLSQILEQPIESDSPDAQDVFPSKPDLIFDDISFSYPSRDRLVLSQVTFQVPWSSSIAVVGATGSGKSSLVRLLLRFYDPQKGDIRLGSISLGQLKRDTLRRNVGVVQQEIYLFEGTLRENILLGVRTSKGASPSLSDASLIELCQRVQLWPFVKERGGLDLYIKEHGSNLSVGEKQLISFARVLLQDPPILIMDEATSSVDRISERAMMDALSEVMGGRTTIIIAHRLQTIQKVDQIIVLEEGRIAERGTYESLTKAGGIFSKFHHLSV